MSEVIVNPHHNSLKKGFDPIVAYHARTGHASAGDAAPLQYVTDFSSVWTPVICTLAANFKANTGTGT